MKTAEFKNYLTELTAQINSAKSLNDMVAFNVIGENIDIDYRNGKLTGRQYDLISGLYNDRYTEFINTKGDKQMSNKKENTTPADTQPAQNAEQPTEAPVEVLKGEVIDTKQEKAINAAIDRISKKVENIGKGYLDIVGDVARLRSLEAWKVTGHKSLYDLCADKFGMARGTVANLEAVFKKYGDPETFKLTNACAGMSLREMLAAISEEKKALKGEVAGEPADGEESGEAGDKGSKKKAESLISITWELAGDDWNVEAILEEIRKQLEANPDAKEAFPDGANVSFTITH